jgi:hypothetical protein
MALSTPTHALGNNAHRRLSLDTSPLRGDFNNLWSNESSPSTDRSSHTGTPSPSTFASSPLEACSPNLSPVRTKSDGRRLTYRIDGTRKRLSPVQRRSSTTKATPHVVVTHFNFQAHYHHHGECLAHPSGWGCDCEKVQLPTMEPDAAWQVMAKRFQAVHSPAVCAPPSAGANAPIDRRQSDPLPHRANALHVEERRARKVPSSLPARSTGPAVLAVPSRVATTRKLRAEEHAHRALPHPPTPPLRYDMLLGAAQRHGGERDSRDLLPASRTSSTRLPVVCISRTVSESAGPRSCEFLASEGGDALVGKPRGR